MPFPLLLLNSLLVLDFLLYVLIALEDLVVFLFSDLKSLVHFGLQFLFQSLHFFLLLHHHVRLRRIHLLLHFVGILGSLLLFNRVGVLLQAVRFGVVLLSGHVNLLLAHVQEFGASFKLLHQFCLQCHAVLLKQLVVALLSGRDFFLVGFLRESQLLVPVFVELLILTNVGLLALLSLGLVHKEELLVLSCELLVFELSDTIVSQLSFNVAALTLHLQTVFVQSLTASSQKRSRTYIN